jgi:hypothetical protein
VVRLASALVVRQQVRLVLEQRIHRILGNKGHDLGFGIRPFLECLELRRREHDEVIVFELVTLDNFVECKDLAARLRTAASGETRLRSMFAARGRGRPPAVWARAVLADRPRMCDN